jgi:acyl-CoA synthetase (AMP-forming)/AMP-acid ligase II
MNISDLLAWSARQWPDKECLVETDPETRKRRSLTYRQFDHRVNKTAHALLKAGIKRGDRVLHFMKNRIEWMESYFAIIRIGAIVVPLNFRFTGTDLEYIVRIVDPTLMIVERDLLQIVEPVLPYLKSSTKGICVGDKVPDGMLNYEEFMGDHSTSHPEIKISEEDPLGIYFTSGTTGVPKPILFTHKSLYTAAVSNGFTIPLGPDHNTLIYCPLYHTATFFFWLPCLFSGGKGTILLKFSLQLLLEAIESEKGTEVYIAMPHCIDLISALERGEIHLKDYDLSSWRLITTGAQPHSPKVLQDLSRLLPEVGIQHGFGISEGGGATLTLLPPHELLKKLGSVGKPSVLVDARVVDQNGCPVKPGEKGELIIKTERMMEEYYQNPKATAEAIKDGWLYTGDIATMDEEGYIYVVDRKKDVVISGGENVYPVEVENVLLTHPKILEAAVIGTPDEKWGERVTAVVRLKTGQEMTKEELFAWCKEQFPSYKCPRRIEFGDLPKSPTNKILKSELRLKYGGRESAF